MYRPPVARPLLLTTGALLCFAWPSTPTRAQAPDSTIARVPVWAQHLGEQLDTELASPSEDVRRAALQHTAYFASFYGDALDLTATLPELLEIYRSADDEQSRLLAVAALHAIGDESAMQELRNSVDLDFDGGDRMRLQFVTMAALADYYGPGTFRGDDQAIRLARSLMDYYLSPRVVVEPPVLIK